MAKYAMLESCFILDGGRSQADRVIVEKDHFNKLSDAIGSATAGNVDEVQVPGGAIVLSRSADGTKVIITWEQEKAMQELEEEDAYDRWEPPSVRITIGNETASLATALHYAANR